MSRKTKAAEFVDEGYKTHVTGRHVLVTDAMKNYAIEKVSRIERFADRIIDVYITMDIQKLEHRCDIVMKAGHIKIKSHAATTDMYVSIDQAVDKLESQLLKYRKRLSDHNGKSLSIVDLKVNVLHRPEEEEIMDVNIAIDEENQREMIDRYRPHKVVAEEMRPLITLNQDEAVMKFELSGDQFLVWRAEEDQKLKVIYRRNDGNFAVIELE